MVITAVWTYDLYQAYIAPNRSDDHYIWMGRAVTVVGILLSIVCAYLVSLWANAMDIIQLVFGFVNAPLFATFLLGMAPQFPNANTYIVDNEPKEWRQPGFDASKWPHTVEIADIWAPLVPSEMPPLMEVRFPALRIEGLTNNTITANGSFRVVFDRVLSAYPTIKVKGGKGAHLILHEARLPGFNSDSL